MLSNTLAIMDYRCPFCSYNVTKGKDVVLQIYPIDSSKPLVLCPRCKKRINHSFFKEKPGSIPVRGHPVVVFKTGDSYCHYCRNRIPHVTLHLVYKAHPNSPIRICHNCYLDAIRKVDYEETIEKIEEGEDLSQKEMDSLLLSLRSM